MHTHTHVLGHVVLRKWLSRHQSDGPFFINIHVQYMCTHMPICSCQLWMEILKID